MPDPKIEVETIRIPSKRERKMQFLRDTREDAITLAKRRSLKNRVNREASIKGDTSCQ